MRGPQVCKHQVCGHSGGWFGMVFQEANKVGSREPPAAATATMAATNKCLAQSNKSDAGGKATKKREIRQPGLIRWVQIIALCLQSSRHFQCCRSHGAKEPC